MVSWKKAQIGMTANYFYQIELSNNIMYLDFAIEFQHFFSLKYIRLVI